MSISGWPILFIKKHFKGTLLAVLLFIVSPSSFGQPAWTTQMPVDEAYYIGIGNVLKSDNVNHIAEARNMALEQIASAIAISITAETSQNTIEQSGMIEETFRQHITSVAHANLEGHELAGKWENDREYWVYYRLSKEDYRILFETRKREAADRAWEYLQRGKMALKENQITPATRFLIQSATEIFPYRGMGVKTNTTEASQSLDIEIFAELQQVLDGLTVSAVQNNLSPIPYHSKNYQTAIKVSYTKEDNNTLAVKDMPLQIEIEQGNAVIGNMMPTNNEGHSQFIIGEIINPNTIRATITINLQTGENQTQTTYPKSLRELFQFPEYYLNLQVEAPKAMIVANRANPLHQQDFITPVIKQKLTAQGWVLVYEARHADFIINLNYQTHDGVERQGIHTAFASGNISIINNSTSEEISRKTIEQTQGAGLSFEAARKQALEKLGDELGKLPIFLQKI